MYNHLTYPKKAVSHHSAACYDLSYILTWSLHTCPKKAVSHHSTVCYNHKNAYHGQLIQTSNFNFRSFNQTIESYIYRSYLLLLNSTKLNDHHQKKYQSYMKILRHVRPHITTNKFQYKQQTPINISMCLIIYSNKST